MKIVSLNTWGGQLQDDLFAFLHKHAPDTDIFCLQEIDDADVSTEPLQIEFMKNFRPIRKQLEAEFPEFTLLYSCFIKGIAVDGRALPNNYSHGNALLVRKSLRLHSYREVFIHGEFNVTTPRDFSGMGTTMQMITVSSKTRTLTVCNVQGYATNAPKGDTPHRIEQSKRIRAAIDPVRTDLVMCGDFNLDPDTKSLEIAKGDLRDHIAENNYPTTRTHHFPQQYKQWADYMFTTPSLPVAEFAVLADVVSDHKALLLRIADK